MQQNANTSKTKKIIGIIVNVLVWLFVIFSVLITVLAVSAGANDKKIPTIGNKCYLKVESYSMKADKPDWAEGKPKGFTKGDLLIGEYIYGNTDKIYSLEKGDIITFEMQTEMNGQTVTILNSHRITEVVKSETDGRVLYFKAQGDNHEVSFASDDVYASQIISVYTGHKIPLAGGVIDLISSKTGFIIAIIVPLGLFFIYELAVFIRTFVKIKNEGKKMITAEDEEAIKQRAIEEYLKMQRQNAADSADNAADGADGADSAAGDKVDAKKDE